MRSLRDGGDVRVAGIDGDAFDVAEGEAGVAHGPVGPVIGGHAHAAERVALVRVEPGRDDEQPGVELAQHRRDHVREHEAVVIVGGAGLERDVDRVATSIGDADFARRTGIKFSLVPYRGTAPALTDIMSGNVQLFIDPAFALLPTARDGTRARALGIASKTRSQLAPDLPTIGEQGLPGFDSASWVGLVAPAKTPAAILNKVQAAVREAVKQPKVSEFLDAAAFYPVASTPDEFRVFVDAELKRYAQSLREAKVAMLLKTSVISASGKTLQLKGAEGNTKPHDIGDCLIIAVGAQPNTTATAMLEDARVPFVTVGDCYQVGDFMTCLRDAWMVGSAIDLYMARAVLAHAKTGVNDLTQNIQ